MDKVTALWQLVLAFVVTHKALVGILIGVYIVVATAINRRLTKPLTWYGKLAHFVFLDWASTLAVKDAEAHGFVFRVGDIEIAVPFLSWSQAHRRFKPSRRRLWRR